jgi:hypothetical protein
VISIIICSVDAAKFAAVEATYASHVGNQPYEIVGVHDARSLCEGYNRGMRRAKGDTRTTMSRFCRRISVTKADR